MARVKKAPPEKKVYKKAKWQGFVNVYLNQQEKELIRSEELSDEEALVFLADMALTGYKVSLSYSPSGKFFTASLTGAYEGQPNAGFCMSLKHSSPNVAITALSHCVESAGKDGDWGDRYTLAGGNDW